MAESCTVAFGRYLRTLRERRNLSLNDVMSLSRAFPEPVDKGYLSRCENGRSRVAFSKLIALSRIYEVPAEVLVERMELDMELDRVGGPSTEGLGFEELTERGKEAAAHGEMWHAYGYLRDAQSLAGSPVLEIYRDGREQALRAIMNYSIPVARHGRYELALHELEYVRSVDGLSDRHVVALMTLLSQQHRSLGKQERATRFADEAVAYAEAVDSDLCKAHAYSNKAFFAYYAKDLASALELNQITFSLFSRLELYNEAARALVNLAQVYFDQSRFRAARRAILSADRIASERDAKRSLALGRVLLGEIEARNGQGAKAVRLWRDAIRIAKANNDHVVRFKAEFQLYKYALQTGDPSTADSMARILRRRAGWVPKDIEEVDEFKSLSGQGPTTWVARSQPS